MILRDGMGRGVLRAEAATEGGEGGGGTPPGGEPALDVKVLQAEIDRLKAENTEKDTNARYWHDQAKKGGAAAPATTTKKADEEEELDPIEVLSREGSKGLDKLLAKRGFVRAEEVEQRINTKAQVIAAENALANEYPDLKDPNSEFFKATAVHYKQLVDAGMPQHLAMQFGAEKAELEGYKTGKRLSKPEKEEREARARAASGDKGKKPSEQEESTDLDAFQQFICDALEVSPEAYKKRAKQGVVFTGR